MNNPIGRMPNPMMVPPISPIGNTGPQQPPSAMPLPVVNQPSVDMQMGNTANQRRRFNDLLESLSAPRQPMVQTFQRGGDVQYLKGGGFISGIGSFANGGPVQYLRGGGPTKPRINRFDTSTNEDTTLTDTASKIGNFFSNLFSGGKSTDTGYGDLTKPGSAFPGSDLNFSEPPKIPTLEGNIVKRVPRGPAFERGGRGTPPLSSINMDILDMPAPMDIPSLTNVVKDVAPPVSPLNIGQYDIVKGMTEADKAFPAPISDPYNIGKMGEFDSSPLLGSIQDPSQIPFKPLTDVTSAVQNQEPLGSGMYSQSGQTPFEVGGGDISGFSTLTPPVRPKNVSQIAENIDAQSGQTDQQGFGIGQLLPLIVGMFNPTAGMALGIMQAMGGQGEGEGLLGGILPNLAKTLGIGDTERTFGDYTFRSLEDPRSGESAGMTPEERRELFLKNQASNERDRARREMQENIDAITKPTVPEPILGEDGSYSCPSPYVYDPNTKMCVMMEAGLGGQGAAANEPEAPAGMQMGGQVSPSLNNAVDNFLQAFA